MVSLANTACYFSSAPTCWLSAACFVTPQDVDQVSAIVRILGRLETTFSIRAGGKNLNPGFASTDGSGVLVSLAKMTTLSLSEDESSLSVGAGLLWDVVYDYVVPKGLIVLGSRYNQVGVSGFLLGGGISFYTNQYGLGIDNVKSFTVVLASGEVVTASAKENCDLYRALRGGSSNFGKSQKATFRHLNSIQIANHWPFKKELSSPLSSTPTQPRHSPGRLADTRPTRRPQSSKPTLNSSSAECSTIPSREST
jgi:FAD/FMN-containing dehydrogenase